MENEKELQRLTLQGESQQKDIDYINKTINKDTEHLTTLIIDVRNELRDLKTEVKKSNEKADEKYVRRDEYISKCETLEEKQSRTSKLLNKAIWATVLNIITLLVGIIYFLLNKFL